MMAVPGMVVGVKARREGAAEDLDLQGAGEGRGQQKQRAGAGGTAWVLRGIVFGPTGTDAEGEGGKG